MIYVHNLVTIGSRDLLGAVVARVRHLCRRSMSFVRSCLSYDSYLIRFVANYAVVHARSQSFLGHNVLCCAHRCNVFVDICNRLSSFDNLVQSFVNNSIDDNMRCFANLLYELIML